MKRYFNYFWGMASTQTAKSTFITTFGAGLNALFGFVFNIIVARSVSPSDFGIFSVVMNLIMMFFVICDVGFSSAVIRYLPQVLKEQKYEEGRKIIKLSFLATLAFSGILAFLLFAFSSPIANLIFAQKGLALPLVIVSFSLVGLTLSFLFTSVLQGQQRFVFGVITDSSVVFIKVVAAVLLLTIGKLDLTSTLIVFSLSSFTGFVIGFFMISPKFLSAKVDLVMAKTLFFFGLWIALARIANAISSRLDTLMLIRYVDPAQVGFYAAAQKMTFIFPIMVTGMTVVFAPKFASLNTLQEAKSLFKKTSLFMTSLLAVTVILFFIAPWLTTSIYTSVYDSSVSIFRLLLVSSAFFVASAIPMAFIIYYLSAPKLFCVISLIQLLLIFIGNLVLIPTLGVIGPALSLAISYGLVFLFGMILVLKKFR